MADRSGYIGRAPGDNSVIIARQTFNPTGVQTDFTFSSGYIPGYLDVYLNGVRLIEANDYTATDTSIVGLTSAAQNGDVVEMVAYKAFNIAVVNEALGDFTIGNNLTVNGDVTVTGDHTTTGDVSGRNFTGVAATFTGNVNVGGVLTYEDVTSVDSLGILTARTGVHVLAGGINVDAGGLNVAGVTTVSQLKSDNVELTGISSIANVTSTNLNATGVSTFSNVVVGGATTELVVTGDARVTGILTVGTASFTINGAVEYPTIRPTLDLNFAATKTLDSRITFTRDGIGTYYDELGVIKYVPNNVPRFDHDPTTGESLGLLIEEERTNNILYSDDLSNANWIKQSGHSMTSNTTVSPDGTQNADTISRSATDQYLYQSVAVTGTHTLSAWVKTPSGDGSKTFAMQCYNTTDGSLGNTTLTATEEWQRFSIQASPTIASGWYPCIPIDLNQDLHIWGVQLEAGTLATSYIPTKGSAVTRGSDQAKITGTNFTDFYNQSEGTFSLTAKPNEPNNGSNYYFIFEAANSSDYGNAVSIGKDNGNTYRLRPMKHSNLSDSSIAYTTNSFKAAVAGSGSNDGVAVLNGTVSATSTGTPSGTQDHNVLHIGNRFPGDSTGHYHGTIKQLTYYPKRLPNAQLQGLTAS